jgi:hypothetical protein
MRAFLLSAVAAAGLTVLAASPSQAQGFGIHVGPGGGGVYVNPDHDRHRGYNDYDNWRISRHEAVRIARRNGMREIYDVDRRGPYWVVRGENRRGRNVSMRIHRNGDWGWH